MSEEEIHVREFMERVLAERDRFYTLRLEDLKRAMETAITSEKDATAFAFAASEKAIVKAEDAQRAYNSVHNDLSHKMDAQYKEMLPRAEAAASEKAMDAKLAVMQTNYDARLETLRLSIEKNAESIGKDITGLREYRSSATGKSAGISTFTTTLTAAVSIIIALTSIAVAVILHSIK